MLRSHQAFGAEQVDRVAHSRAGYAVGIDQVAFAGQLGARRELAGRDLLAEIGCHLPEGRDSACAVHHVAILPLGNSS